MRGSPAAARERERLRNRGGRHRGRYREALNHQEVRVGVSRAGNAGRACTKRRRAFQGFVIQKGDFPLFRGGHHDRSHPRLRVDGVIAVFSRVSIQGGGAGERDGGMSASKTLTGKLKSAAKRATRLALITAAALYVLHLGGKFLLSYDYGKHTLELIRWLRKDVGLKTGCSVLTVLTVIATPMFITTTPFNVGAGAVYGVWTGSLISLVGTTVGAVVCFVATRFGPARQWARQKIASNKTLTALDVATVNGGAGIVMLSRLSPMFPFAVCSFAFGACQCTFWDFLSGTVVGLVPGTVMTSYIGWNLYDVTKKGASEEESIRWAMYRLIFVVVLTVVSGLGLGIRINQIIRKQAGTLIATGAAGMGGGLSPIGGLGAIGGLGSGKTGKSLKSNIAKGKDRGVLSGGF